MLDLVQGTKLAKTAIELWRGDAESLRRTSDAANLVYSFVESGKTLYLRLTSSLDRTRAQIEAELEFISYLRRGGVNAMPPIPSAEGRSIEEMPIGDRSIFACVFETAKGGRFSYDPANPDKKHFRLCGRTLGKIHALSKTYLPLSEHRRFSWDEDIVLLETRNFLPESEKVVWREFDLLKERLVQRPKSNETYGLTHGDFGATNYRSRGDCLNIFDFDDSCYHWYAYDLAVAIYPHGWRKEASQLWHWLFEGYCENMDSGATLSDIVMFCRWRLVYMFLVYARKWGLENLSGRQAEWFALKRENITRGYSWDGALNIQSSRG